MLGFQLKNLLIGSLGLALLGLSSTASAAVPPSQRFDLSAPSHDLFRSKSLHDATVQQGFAFDNTNRRLFVAQRRDGSSETSGDLCVTQLDFNGKVEGHMYLTGFGHGVSFAAEGVGASTYLWTEVDSNKNGYGQKLARFEFKSGTTLSHSAASLTKFTPVDGATEHTCSIDPVNNRLIVRYNKDGKRITAFDLEDASKGNFSHPLTDIKHPSLKTLSSTFQGYAAYGQYLYLQTGNSYDVTKNKINSELTTIDINTGAIVEGPTLTKAGSTLSFREPEGLAIYETATKEIRLFLGFASGKGGDRRSNLFYKNVLV
ncbi:hypothetical protein ASPWEDRAFT_435722 [Aspergillus wentii DTO 134E9]|uniref:P68 RBP/TagC-like beta-propeller domain-containing protein n=1 Tax=Aspergillus wentii DTO 134E9 TaxID=1073089 RepID=A0A1L9RPS1_ASPWE|nr:uncharacterized protein ASPWEDRAFT_435722 [Aspergillus wentii DTO 134E9]KAI9923937.1 hypothetical protein MW887_008243 [Aspergillus wentii]OJJ36924.1 hypothetical protein ASPWEDRAFT_435722 [Aspergillus wentii DTO 134E9]